MNNSIFSAEQAIHLIQEGAFLVDVRSPMEFATGSAPGAVNIPLDEIPYSLEQFQGKSSVIVFCRSGNRSAHAKFFLDQNGVPNVVNGGTFMDVTNLVSKAKA